MKELPEYNEDITCENPECKHIEAQVMVGMYGLFGGGGMGAYTMCENCGTVLSKSCDTHKDEENEPTEIKTADVQDTDANEP
jgi:hypothetical protein